MSQVNSTCQSAKIQLVRCLGALPICQGLPIVTAEADFVRILPNTGISKEAKAVGNYT